MNEANYLSLITQLDQHRLKDLPKNEGEIHPNYQGYSIANLPASILGWLGVPPLLENPLAEEILGVHKKSYKHIIFLLVDGLKLEFFRRFLREALKMDLHKDWKHIMEKAQLFPLSSISPSTTSAALTTLWTGRLPSEHGIIGYELFLKEFGFTANMIFHSVASFIGDTGTIYRAGFDPDTFLPVPTLGPILSKHGVKSFAFQHSSISSSGLSQMLLKGVKSVAFDSSEDLWKSVEHVHAENMGQATYAYIYWGGLDTLSHHSGPDAPQLYDEWLRFAKSLAGFLNRISMMELDDTLFILTADHGQIATEVLEEYDLHNHPEFTRHLVMMPTGESRLPYLFVKNGHEALVSDYLKEHWSGQFSMLPSSKVLEAGLLGPANSHISTIDRMGSHIVFPKNNAYWWWVNKENHLYGRHGGISRDEMLVPLFTLEL
jgi:predicted AlkP superfamily pyrophosphatase or phosphodiesterase